MSVAPLFGWKDAEFLDRVNIQQRCLISQDVSYQIFATCATFYVPLAVILIVYWKIFQTARRRIRKRPNQNHQQEQQQQLDHGHLNHDANDNRKMMRRWFKCPAAGASSSAEESEHIKEDEPPARTSTDDGQHTPNQQTTAFTIEIPAVNAMPVTPESNAAVNAAAVNRQSPLNGSTVALSSPVIIKTSSAGPAATARTTENAVRKKRETLEAKRERKAAKTLAIITGAFVVCWLPFFVCALLMPLRPDWVFDETMLSVFLWLGYFNSTLNPIIYTIFSPEFRQAFKRLLCGKAAVNGTSAYRPRKLR